MEEEITVMNSIRHFCFFTLTFLGNAVILIRLLNMMQTQMSLAEYKDWKYGQNSLDFLKKKNCDFLELCCCCEIYLRSHCMLIIPCKRSVLYGWKKLDVFSWSSFPTVYSFYVKRHLQHAGDEWYWASLQNKKANKRISQKAKLLPCFSSISWDPSFFYPASLFSD